MPESENLAALHGVTTRIRLESVGNPEKLALLEGLHSGEQIRSYGLEMRDRAADLFRMLKKGCCGN